jgi:alkylation response protein AidB-like acyl-CoA dehydrogenase
VTNALGWVAATPPSWFPPVATAEQAERYLKPTVRGEREECYAITEEGAGTDVDAIEATARRDGDHWLLTESNGMSPASTPPTTVFSRLKDQ